MTAVLRRIQRQASRHRTDFGSRAPARLLPRKAAARPPDPDWRNHFGRFRQDIGTAAAARMAGTCERPHESATSSSYP
jgi:hypothetical protein